MQTFAERWALVEPWMIWLYVGLLLAGSAIFTFLWIGYRESEEWARIHQQHQEQIAQRHGRTTETHHSVRKA